MSSKAAKRREGYAKRQAKRDAEHKRQQAIRNAVGIEELAKAMGVPLGPKEDMEVFYTNYR